MNLPLHKGFTDYIQQVELKKAESVILLLQSQYQQHESRQFIKHYRHRWDTVLETARIETPPPQGQRISQSLDISDELLSDSNELLNEYYSDDISDDDKATTLSSIQDILKATAPEGGLINETA